MRTEFKKRLVKLIAFLFLSFLALFLFRLAYGYTKTINDRTGQTNFFQSIANSKRNFASKKYKSTSNQPTMGAVSIDQKYEKVAEIGTKSTAFDDEEKQTRNEVERFKGLIQFEQKSGNKGHRKLNLLIGVPPENFDNLYNSLIGIGKVHSKQITKKDKTNEYKELNAKKNSLEKIRSSLIDLKTKSGKIEEYMQLENRILEIERQLQELGVSLGDFDNENEFCTVKFSLLEGKKVKISFLHRVKVALEWTIQYYLMLMTSFFFMALFAFLMLLIIEKLKIFERMM